MAKKRLVAIVIPIYNPLLSPNDKIALRNIYKTLGSHPIYVVHPEGMDISIVSSMCPMIQYKTFYPSFFNSIEGYNRLMLSRDFYETFAEYEYILIAQLDTYIFKDELSYWCSRGYDYIGAPWLRRDIYNMPLIKQLVSVYQSAGRLLGRRSHYDRYGRIGNGGLSLRKVDSHLRALIENPDLVVLYSEINNRRHLFNEDTFWAMEIPWFKYPTVDEAMLFAYNKYPELSYERTGGRLPFGCHGWTKPKYCSFWISNGLIPHSNIDSQF